jgi:CheY-like chemotaxis protein
MQKKILVVDDDVLFLELIGDLLQRARYEVVTAGNGKAALEILAQQTVDVIISDFEMPTMNGIAFHANVSSDKRRRRIPFIFVTGSGDRKMLEYVEANPSVTLIKKIELTNELLPAVERALA